MKIQKVEEKDLNDLINYNSKIFPHRENIAESIYYRLYKNPFNINRANESLIAVNKNEIVGQTLLMPSELIFEKVKHQIFWGIDFFVDMPHRGITGFMIAKKAIEVENHFGVGLTKVSLDLHLKLGQRIVGYLIKYIRFASIFSIFRFLSIIKTKKPKNYLFPETIELKGGKFIRITNSQEIGSQEGYWNEDLIEFSRNEEFINWRFLYYSDKYFIYKYFPYIKSDDSKPTYFVVQPLIWKKVPCLFLIDYRFSASNIELFGKILRASVKLTKKLKLAATLTSCSLPQYNKLIRKHWFIKFGEKLAIVSKLGFYKEQINSEKNTIMVTFADSDCGFNYEYNI